MTGVQTCALPISPKAAPAGRTVRLLPPLVLQFALLIAVFVAVPVILYRQFEGADQAKKALLLRSVQEQGWLIAEAMRPVLSGPTPPALPIVGRELAKYGVGEATLRILFQPANVVNADGFYYVASVPTMPTELLASEREEQIGRAHV